MPLSTNGPDTRARIGEIIREIGTLLVAFAPLDAAVSPDADPMSPYTLLLSPLIGGVVLAACGFALMYLERRAARRGKDQRP